MIDLVLVDFDDTLVNTGPRFQDARRGLIRLLTREGFDDDVARHALFHEIDPGMRERYGLGPRRMEPAFVATYRHLCQMHGVPVREDVEAEAASLGRACYGSPAPFEGALEALRLLAGTHPTVIYTQSGDADYQRRCVRDVGIVGILPEERVHVCARKDAEVFARTLETYGIRDAKAAWMIGNSIRSDINPALEVGANAILVSELDPWEFDQVEPVAETFHRVESFPDAVEFLVGRS